MEREAAADFAVFIWQAQRSGLSLAHCALRSAMTYSSIQLTRSPSSDGAYSALRHRARRTGWCKTTGARSGARAASCGYGAETTCLASRAARAMCQRSVCERLMRRRQYTCKVKGVMSECFFTYPTFDVALRVSSADENTANVYNARTPQTKPISDHLLHFPSTSCFIQYIHIDAWPQQPRRIPFIGVTVN